MRNPIPIDHLTEAELVDLNRRVVTRLRFLHDMKLHARMLDFSVGEKVSFQPDGHPVLFAAIVKYNRKTFRRRCFSSGRRTVKPRSPGATRWCT